MSRRWSSSVALLLAVGLTAAVQARDEPAAIAAPTPALTSTQALVVFASDEGLARLARASAKTDFAALANQFEAQSNAAFCGPTSAAIVLNAANAGTPDRPRDRTRLHPEDWQYLPSGFDLTVPRYTQESVIEKGAKSRARIFGAPVSLNGKPVQDGGFQLRQLDELLHANGLGTRLVIVDDYKADDQIRADLASNLSHAGDYVIVNYQRGAVGQQGGAHISPLGAYDAASDSVLVMDVNPTRAPWVWMPVTTLIRGMRTFDTVENRGYILSDLPAPR